MVKMYLRRKIKKMSFVALFVIWAVSLSLTSRNVYAKEFLNDSFEEGIRYWKVVPPEQVEIDTAVYKEGKKSLKTIRPEGEGWCNVSQDATVIGGIIYEVSAWIKMENAFQTHFKVDYYSKESKHVGTDFVCLGQNGTKDWFKVSKIVTVPDEADIAVVRCLGGGSLDKKNPGLSWFDGVKFSIKENTLEKEEEWEKITKAKYGENMIAPPIREKIIYFDERYDYNWIRNIEGLLTFFKERGFIVKNADQLKKWMQEKIKEGADGTVCIMGMDICPDTILEEKSPNCTFQKYMEQGGRIVWIGDIPLFHISFSDKIFDSFGGDSFILGINSPGEYSSSDAGIITKTGENWGMKIPDTLKRPVLKEMITLPFTVKENNEKIVGSYFKNFNKEYPYSGFIRYRATNYDGDAQSLNEDVYRLSLYRGETIEVPIVPKKEVKKENVGLKITTEFKNYFRGQEIPLTIIINQDLLKKDIFLFLEVKEKSEEKVIQEFKKVASQVNHFKLTTSTLSSGDYCLIAKVKNRRGETLSEARYFIYLAPKKTPKFLMAVFGPLVIKNKCKMDIVLNDISQHLEESGAFVTDINQGSEDLHYLFDQSVRYGLKAMGKSNAYYSTMLPPDKEVDLHLSLSTGEKKLMHYFDRGTCLGNPIIQKRASDYFMNEIKNVYHYPSFQSAKTIFINDDVVLHGTSFWGDDKKLSCYCQNCRDTFRKLTGLEAPVSPLAEVLKKKGIISDKDPWYLWMKFRSHNVVGEFNKSMKKAKDEIDPEIKFGPLHGCGAPVFNPYWGLNPPDDYAGCDYLSYYYYPEKGSLFRIVSHCKLAKMGNRNKLLFPTLQLSDFTGKFSPGKSVPAWHVRNQFWLALSSGSKEICWFAYSGAPGSEGWEELKRLALITTKFGPLLLNLDSISSQVGILASYTNASYKWFLGEGFLSGIEDIDLLLTKSHIPTDMISEEEILEGMLKNYKILVLSDVDFLPWSVYQKIIDYNKHGGIVLIDERSEISIPGSKVMNNNLFPEEIKKIIDSNIRLDNENIIFNQFQIGEAKFLFLVNTATDEATKVKITFPYAKNSTIYDIFSGELIKLDRMGNFSLIFEPGGGKLLGIYPDEIIGVNLKLAKDSFFFGEEVKIKIEVEGGEKTSLPISIIIKDPKGVRNDYSDFYLARGGKLEIAIPLAINDLPGKWSITVEELSSGKKNTQTFLVRERREIDYVNKY